jgi:hypothetical protein
MSLGTVFIRVGHSKHGHLHHGRCNHDDFAYYLTGKHLVGQKMTDLLEATSTRHMPT